MFKRAALLAGFCVVALLARSPKATHAAAPHAPAAARSGASPAQTLRSLSLEDKAAQLVIMPFQGEAINVRSKNYRRYVHYVRDLHVGGLILTGRSQYGMIRNAEPFALASLINRMQALAPVPLLIGADFERGASMRVNDSTPWPHNMAFTAGRDIEAARYEGAAAAREARALGVQWLFAPVADVNNNPDNPIINIRSYSEKPEDVAAYVSAYIEGAHSQPDAPVLVTVKHFPGHGDTGQDSHLGLARIEATRERMNAVELVPFRAAVKAGVDAVMTAHMAVPAIEPDNIPATVSSKVLTGLLKNDLNFKGLVVTDGMEMAGLMKMFDTAEASVRALEAGADVLLLPRSAEEAINGVVNAVRQGRISRERLDASVLKILNAKAKLALARNRAVDIQAINNVIDSPEAEAVAQHVSDRAVTLVKDEQDLLPIRNRDGAALVILTENRYAQEGRRMLDEVKKRSLPFKTYLADPKTSQTELDEIAANLTNATVVIVAAFATVRAARGNVALAGELPGFVSALCAAKPPVILGALGNPYLLRNFPAAKVYITTFSSAPLSEVSFLKAILGEQAITGKLPVTIPGYAQYGDGIQLPAGAVSPQKGY